LPSHRPAVQAGNPGETDEVGQEPGGPLLEPGQVFQGRYVIQEEVGQGPLGTVHLVFDRSQGTWRALKVLRRSGGLEALDRLAGGLRSWASLSHPGVVALGEVDLAGDRPYFTMEMVRGSSLNQILDEWREAGRTMDLFRAGGLVLNILEILGAAHRTMVHGDLKPENVLVQSGTKELVVKITDWGLGAGLSVQEFRSLAQGHGTVDYASPERLQGQSRLTPAADLFSIGVAFYEMLTGVTPSGPFDPPSRLVSGLSLEVDELLEKSLRTWPGERYSSADRFADRLRGIMDASPARPPGSPQPRKPIAVKPEPVRFRPEAASGIEEKPPWPTVKKPAQDRATGWIKWMTAVILAIIALVIIALARLGVLDWLIK
jgi:serine/threonine-protein kinase